ncbi:MAG: hypothetical protein KAI17_13370 [Thiotrichaceae bacterium]|nr:hypothetical protein [Thiotrichaceae bacterium]
MNANTNQLQDFLQISIDQYSDMIALMGSITQSHKNHSIAKISTIVTEILAKQAKITATDEQLLPLLKASSDALKNDSRMTKRTELVKRAIQLNAIITKKITNIKSLMKSELQQIKKGRFAVKGYQQAEVKHGKNINNTL